MTDNQFAEAHNIINLLLRFGDDFDEAMYFERATVLAAAEARIRELIAEENAILNVDRSVTSCPKCGHKNVVTQYQAAGRGCQDFSHYKHQPWDHSERFERTCKGCRYVWYTYDVLGAQQGADALPEDAGTRV